MKTFLSLITISLLLFSCQPDAAKPEVYNVEGIALDGYDPVAYFVQGEPRIGTALESVEYKGLTYRFTNTKNKVLFEENPEAYLPQYGGWCVYAVAENATKMEPDPTLWQIQDGELQLFYDSWMTAVTGNLKDEWNTDSIAYSQKAEINWEKIK